MELKIMSRVNKNLYICQKNNVLTGISSLSDQFYDQGLIWSLSCYSPDSGCERFLFLLCLLSLLVLPFIFLCLLLCLFICYLYFLLICWLFCLFIGCFSLNLVDFPLFFMPSIVHFSLFPLVPILSFLLGNFYRIA